jgi:hypothetical protein
LLEVTDRSTEVNRLFVTETSPILENMSQENSRDGDRTHFAFMRLGPFAIRRRQKVNAAPKRKEPLLVNMTPKSLVVDAVAINDFGATVKAKTFRSIRPPLLVQASGGKKGLRTS